MLREAALRKAALRKAARGTDVKRVACDAGRLSVDMKVTFLTCETACPAGLAVLTQYSWAPPTQCNKIHQYAPEIFGLVLTGAKVAGAEEGALGSRRTISLAANINRSHNPRERESIT